MIKCEYYNTRKDGVMLVRTFSDNNKYIHQVETGIDYTDAIDVGEVDGENCRPIKFTYIETDIEIEEEENNEGEN